MTGAGDPTADSPEDPSPGEGAVYFEETLSMSDPSGAGGLLRTSRVLFAGLALATIAAFVLVVGTMVQSAAASVGGMDRLLAVVTGIAADRPLVAAGLGGVGVLTVLWLVVAILGMGRATKGVGETVHTRVTDAGLSVRREGGRRGRLAQSDGVDVPFEAVTAVEYVDPEASSFRMELGDWRAPKFFGGRSKQWIRVVRAEDPAVYVGSDRPQDLAETIARHVPEVTATPY